jgi:hypothetical protein
MNRILKGNGRVAGTVFAETDANFIAVLNALLKLADPSLTLIGYADIAEPASPETGDSYLVLEAGTVWELTVEEHEIISWDGEAWEVQNYKLSELNAAFQALFFDAENIMLDPVYGLTATNVQGAIEELAAALFGSPDSSGSGSGSGSGSV